MGALVRADAGDRVDTLIERAEVEDADFVVVEGDGFFYAFRRHELDRITERMQPAHTALALAPWKASPAIAAGAPLPRLNKEGSAPSSWRVIVLGRDGRPQTVIEPAGHTRKLGGAAPQATGTVSVERYPSIEASAQRSAGAAMTLTIDLLLQGSATSKDPIKFDGLPANWREVAITVIVSSPQLDFEDGAETGAVVIRRDKPSLKCRIPCTVSETLGTQDIEVTATFMREDRWCGSAKRVFTATAAGSVKGAVAIPEAALAPDLSVHIHRFDSQPTRLHWLLVPAEAHRQLMVAPQSEETDLERDPEAFVRNEYELLSKQGWQEHVREMQGFGSKLWDLTPQSFRDNYWALRDKLGGFTIQIVSDEPWIPWELMRPRRKDAGPQPLLGELHPVGRALLDYPDRVRAALPADGKIVTIAPDYTKRTAEPVLRPLPDALAESQGLQERFNAVRLAAQAGAVFDALEGKRGAIRILHFAGHGVVNGKAPATLACEDQLISLNEVRRQETVLGERFHTFVILNACDAGTVGHVLRDIGGWAETFVERGFSGFVAPLWAVFDGQARVVVEKLFELLLVERKRVGEALRDIRATYGRLSPTFLSYVYFGDVNARFA